MLIKLKLDDVVDAVPVHFLNGLWGVIVVGLLSEPELTRQAYGTNMHPGFFYSLAQGRPNANLLGCQVVGALFIIGWTLITMAPFFLVLNHFEMLRSEAVEELVGLDVCYNGDEGYEKENSDGEDAALRDEYMTAYEDYRQNRSKHGSHHKNPKVIIPPEEPERSPVPADNTSDSNSGSDRGRIQFQQERFQEEYYDETASV